METKNYRQNVGIVVFNQNKQVLMCSRVGCKDSRWQFPQGGQDAGEDVLTAAKRELREETGITSVRFIAQSKEPTRYDFPPEVLKNVRKAGHPHDGQEQRWVLFEFLGKDSEIDFLTHPEEIEFDSYEWTDIEEAPKRIVYFKKEVYNKVVAEFKPYIK